ncbi:hypothetical protein MNBD_PLANCTO03-577, partial [hydrothermal vent metagenome]
MTTNRSNLPLILAAAGAGASMVLLAGVVTWRVRTAVPADPEQTTSPANGNQVAADRSEPLPKTDPITPILDAADTLVRQHQADRAEAVLRAAIREHPEDQQLRLALAGACILQHKLGAAYEQYEAALAIGPRTAETEFNAGTLASQLGRLDRAEEHFATAQATDTADARFPLYLAQVQVRQGRIPEARKNLLLATRLDETLAVAWGTLAELSLRGNEPNIAIQLVARARQLEPRVAAWRVIEARAKNRIGKPAEALVALGGISEAERRQLPILRLIGQCYGMMGKPAEAMHEFEAAL